MTNAEGYASFVIRMMWWAIFRPDPRRLVPIAAAGYDIGQLVAGAAYMWRRWPVRSAAGPSCRWYAAARQLLYRQGRPVEISVTYEPGLLYLLEWWKQLTVKGG